MPCCTCAVYGCESPLLAPNVVQRLSVCWRVTAIEWRWHLLPNTTQQHGTLYGCVASAGMSGVPIRESSGIEPSCVQDSYGAYRNHLFLLSVHWLNCWQSGTLGGDQLPWPHPVLSHASCKVSAGQGHRPPAKGQTLSMQCQALKDLATSLESHYRTGRRGNEVA
jgi:hypothetical protein